jgi:putative glycosyltransferase (TIGR04348 family)
VPHERSIVIVTPALADANNGNWQTASRWARMLAPRYRTRIVQHWPDGDASERDDAMVALHAVRSLASINMWAGIRGDHGLAVVMTGTDLYGIDGMDPLSDIALLLARHVVVLQERGKDMLPPSARSKARVIFQSAPKRPTLTKSRTRLRAVMVGHLRDVKSPETLFDAALLLRGERDVFIDHIGEALEARLGARARATAKGSANYRWLGGLPHEDVRRRIQRAHVLVHTSRAEGGAHAILEAVRSGTPVLASAVDGNIGMLGARYAGYFDHGSPEQLAALLLECRDEVLRPRSGALLKRLREQCRARSPLFDPDREKAAVQDLAADLLGSS